MRETSKGVDEERALRVDNPLFRQTCLEVAEVPAASHGDVGNARQALTRALDGRGGILSSDKCKRPPRIFAAATLRNVRIKALQKVPGVRP